MTFFDAWAQIESHIQSLASARDEAIARGRVNSDYSTAPSRDALAAQIAAIRTIAKYSYGRDDAQTSQITFAIADWLAARGVHSVFDIGYARGNSDLIVEYPTISGDSESGEKSKLCFYDDLFFDRTSGKTLSSLEPSDCHGRPLPLLCDIDLGSGDWLRVFLMFTADGFPLFYGTVIDTGPESWGGAFWHDFRGALVTMGPLIGIALAVFIPGAGVAVGSAVVGSATAAAYPALTAAIGNALLTACINGGNIEAAVIGAAAGYIGSSAGAAVKAATDSGALGVASQSAVTAMIRGGDIKAAVSDALLLHGLKSMDDLSFFNTTTPSEETVMLPSVDPGFDPSFSFDFTTPTVPFSALVSPDLPSAAGSGIDWGFSSPVPAPAAPIPNANPAPVSSGGGTSGWDVAMAAIKTLPIFFNKSVPAVTTATRTVTGSVDPRTLAVGQPAQLPDGRIVVNNGNGTYSVVDSLGRTTTSALPGASSSGFSLGNLSPLALALAGVGLFIMARGRR